MNLIKLLCYDFLFLIIFINLYLAKMYIIIYFIIVIKNISLIILIDVIYVKLNLFVLKNFFIFTFINYYYLIKA